MSVFKPPGQCPACGEWVPKGQVACPDCGACARSGWRLDELGADGLDLPNEEFDYDAFIRREFGGNTRKGAALNFWQIVGLILVAVMLLGLFLTALH